MADDGFLTRARTFVEKCAYSSLNIKVKSLENSTPYIVCVIPARTRRNYFFISLGSRNFSELITFFFRYETKKYIFSFFVFT